MQSVTRAVRRVPIALRVEPALAEQVEVMRHRYAEMDEEPVDRSEAARRLLRLGVETELARSAPAVLSEEPRRTPEETVAILNFLTDLVNDHLETVTGHYPVGGVVYAHNFGVGLQRWAEQAAERYNSTVEQMLATVPDGPQS